MKQSTTAFRRFRLRAGLPILFSCAAVLLADPRMALPCLLAAAFHECGHLLAARLLHVPLSELRLDLFGARISVSSGLISYRAEFFLCAAGPLFSFLLAELLSLPCLSAATLGDGALAGLLPELRDASRFLGILNLLPVRGFDGARMLGALLGAVTSPGLAETVDRLCTGFFLLLLWGISVYLLLLTGGGLTLFVFSAGLFCKVFLT